MKRFPGFIIAGTQSGSGKTTIALGLMAWLMKNGYQVAPFKVGPDFIDPGHHTRITGRVSRNLDGWMLSREYNLATYQRQAETADIAVVEGVMGLYDGFAGDSEAGSTAEMAKWLDLPVILVVNAKSMARSAAALIKGFVEFDPQVKFAGIVFNNLGSCNHYHYLKDATQAYLQVPLLGGILREAQITMPERHLGLVTREEHLLQPADIGRLADLVGEGVDTAQLVHGLCPSGATSLPTVKEAVGNLSGTPSTLRIGVARDAAFCFYYQDNLDLLTQHGVTLVYFSPLKDEGLPKGISGLYFGGGYPEVFAAELSANQGMCQAVKQACEDRMPIYGECGGFMYLCRSFFDRQGKEVPLAGCFPYSTHMRDRFSALGYREAILDADTVIGKAGMCARGHEFHYSELKSSGVSAPEGGPVRMVYHLSGRGGISGRSEGYMVNNTLGSYVHLHFGSNPAFCDHFVASCRRFAEQRPAALNNEGDTGNDNETQ